MTPMTVAEFQERRFDMGSRPTLLISERERIAMALREREKMKPVVDTLLVWWGTPDTDWYTHGKAEELLSDAIMGYCV